MSRPSLRPLRLLTPSADDIQLALEGDKSARKRIKQQKCRAKKREQEILQWDVQHAEAR